MSAHSETKYAFLGSGIIAEAWITRLLSIDWLRPEQVMVCDIRPERVQALHERFGVRASTRNAEGAAFAEVIILAPPPPEAVKVLREVAGHFDSSKTVISLAAGLPVDRLQAEVKPGQALRIMPNAPGQVGEGMNLVAYGNAITAERKMQIERLLGALGTRLEVSDDQMDFWCALCAVGPTYIYPVIEALASAAAAKGLPPDQALQAVAQVVAGAARMVQQTGKTIPQLKEMISIRTLREPEVAKLFGEAYDEAVARLQGLSQRLSLAA